ncbi:MAG: class D beta-lactamase [Saprospiraceae bacterium]|jgi:beta-lactamase class D|nr:class D beta-lactamase [Saprospiraceae bacterium]MBL0024024.1 class D beta-lactamase [Saprospiraceae bacterium]
MPTNKLHVGLLLFTINVIVFFTACSHRLKTSKEIVRPEFSTILDSLSIYGSVLIYDQNEDIYYANDFEWARKQFLPASTFKIPNTIISLETGIMQSDTTVIRWDGTKRWLKVWEEDLTLRQAFQVSCVPCYQEIARQIGKERMRHYLDKLSYPGMKFDNTTIDNFWLEGRSGISQFEQISFLKRLYNTQLPISKRTEKLIRKIMVIDNKQSYILSGKTGLSTQNGQNGWFTGFLEANKNVYFFATNVKPRDNSTTNEFSAARIKATRSILNLFYNTK